MRSIGIQLVSVSLSTLFASDALAQEWTFVNLHPGGHSSSCVGAGGGQQVGYSDGRPSVWSGTAESWYALYAPPGPYTTWYVTGIDAGVAVGYWDYAPPDDPLHLHYSWAVLWRANNQIETLPTDSYATAFGISGSQQVGQYLPDPVIPWAAMWSGPDHSVVILHPAGAYMSTATGCHSGQEVGEALLYSGSYHAGLWTGTAQSWVDLNPAGASSSHGTGIYAGEQVGYCVINGITHACLWHGTAASWVDLAPVGAEASSARAVYEGVQVGYATLGGIFRAGLWRGSANSWVDLSAYLPAEFSGASTANGISSDGAFIYVVGTAYTLSGSSRAVLWRAPVPCEGDLDGNRIVNLEDLAVLLSHYGTPEGATAGDGDLDGDGDVDLQDLAGLLARFGSTCL